MSTPGSPGSKAPTIDEHLDAAGFGWYQIRIFLIMSMLVVADGMEMTVLSMLRKPLQREFGLDDYGFAALGSGEPSSCLQPNQSVCTALSSCEYPPRLAD